MVFTTNAQQCTREEGNNRGFASLANGDELKSACARNQIRMAHFEKKRTVGSCAYLREPKTRLAGLAHASAVRAVAPKRHVPATLSRLKNGEVGVKMLFLGGSQNITLETAISLPAHNVVITAAMERQTSSGRGRVRERDRCREMCDCVSASETTTDFHSPVCGNCLLLFGPMVAPFHGAMVESIAFRGGG
jgi:hypothetical protein